MRFQVLGPLRAWDGSAWTAIGAAHQRAVLAVLLAETGRPVSVDRLVDEIWGEQPPRTARHAVQVYVRRLRQLPGEGAGGTLVTRGQAYQLDTGEDDLGAAVFERLVETGTRRVSGGELERGAAELAEALALWRGPVLSDVPAGPAVTAEVARLDRRRLTATEERLHALLELGRHAGIVDELQRLVEPHPLRERLYGQLMLAPFRSGRRGEALAAYRRPPGAGAAGQCPPRGPGPAAPAGQRRGHVDEAIDLLDRALSVHRALADQHTEGDTTRSSVSPRPGSTGSSYRRRTSAH
jgi:DNA-binding SARP family transcriptional activator